MATRTETSRWLVFLLGLIVFAAPLLRAQSVSSEPAPLSGKWQVNGFPDVRITFLLNGTGVTGKIQDSADIAEIFDGAAAGNTINFKTRSGDGDRTITFAGIIERDRITFLRRVDVRPGGKSGNSGILGASGPLTFTIRPEGALFNASQLTGRWTATGMTGSFLNLVIDGSKVFGTTENASSPPQPIFDGWIDGDIIFFKVIRDDRARLVTFRGRIGDDKIDFSRTVEVLSGGLGGTGIYGTNAPSAFTAIRTNDSSSVLK